MTGPSRIDFGLLEDRLNKGDIETVKNIITPLNIKERDLRGVGILSYLCSSDYADDPDLLEYFIKLGASLELDLNAERRGPLHYSADRKKHRTIRKLLEVGTPVNILDGFKITPFYCAISCFNNEKCICILWEAGGRDIEEEPVWCGSFEEKRKNTRETSVIILGLLHCKSKIVGKNGKDVLRIISRVNWSLRGLGYYK